MFMTIGANMVEDKSKSMNIEYDWRNRPLVFKLRKNSMT